MSVFVPDRKWAEVRALPSNSPPLELISAQCSLARTGLPDQVLYENEVPSAHLHCRFCETEDTPGSAAPTGPLSNAIFIVKIGKAQECVRRENRVTLYTLLISWCIYFWCKHFCLSQYLCTKSVVIFKMYIQLCTLLLKRFLMVRMCHNLPYSSLKD